MNIVDLIKGYISPDLISKAGSFLGESEGGISKAVSGLVPALLGGVFSKATSNEAGAEEVLGAAREANSSGILGNLSSLFGNDDLLTKGTRLFNGLFGGKSGSIIDSIANFAGIKSSSSGSLISMLTPVVFGLLGKHASANNLDAKGLSNFLSAQKNNIAGALPSGLGGSLSSLLGLGGLAGGVGAAAGSIGSAAREAAGDVRNAASSTLNYAGSRAGKAGGGMKWLLPLLLLAGLGLLLWWLMSSKGCNKADTGAATNDSAAVYSDGAAASGASDTPTAAATGGERTLAEVTLPSGKKLQAYPGGVEDQLIRFIQSDEYKNATEDQLKGKWFNFDDLNFEFGTTTLTAASQRQVDNIIAILQEFPDVKIKLGTYTDKKGSDAANLQLSQKRADAVKAAFSAVASQVAGAEGYGEKFATVDENASDKEREADRKTSVRLTK